MPHKPGHEAEAERESARRTQRGVGDFMAKLKRDAERISRPVRADIRRTMDRLRGLNVIGQTAKRIGEVDRLTRGGEPKGRNQR